MKSKPPCLPSPFSSFNQVRLKLNRWSFSTSPQCSITISILLRRSITYKHAKCVISIHFTVFAVVCVFVYVFWVLNVCAYIVTSCTILSLTLKIWHRSRSYARVLPVYVVGCHIAGCVATLSCIVISCCVCMWIYVSQDYPYSVSTMCVPEKQYNVFRNIFCGDINELENTKKNYWICDECSSSIRYDIEDRSRVCNARSQLENAYTIKTFLVVLSNEWYHFVK